jgi:hypothetical protein
MASAALLDVRRVYKTFGRGAPVEAKNFCILK